MKDLWWGSYGGELWWGDYGGTLESTYCNFKIHVQDLVCFIQYLKNANPCFEIVIIIFFFIIIISTPRWSFHFNSLFLCTVEVNLILLALLYT